MDRRAFVKGCVFGVGLICEARRVEAAPPAEYPRVALADAAGAPLRPSALAPHEAYCFFYPYASTPCLLHDMEAPVPPALPAPGDTRPGGVGPRASIVGYTAICSDQLSHPNAGFSPIHYLAPGQRDALVRDRDRLIVCCAHSSAFDPAAGGRVAQSPARLPLASIVLEWNAASDALFATAVRGPDSFERFFTAFDRERTLVAGPARVVPLSAYSRKVATC